MGILRMGNQIRLTGKDASVFHLDTGRQTLPKTVEEYNRALQEAYDTWMEVGSPEAILLAHMAKDGMIVD